MKTKENKAPGLRLTLAGSPHSLIQGSGQGLFYIWGINV